MPESTSDKIETARKFNDSKQKRLLLRIVMLAIGTSLLFPPVVRTRQWSSFVFTDFGFLFSLRSYDARVDVFLLLAIWVGILLIAAIYWEFLNISQSGNENAHRRNPFKFLVVILFASALVGGVGDVSSNVGALRRSLDDVSSSIDSLEGEIQNCQNN